MMKDRRILSVILTVAFLTVLVLGFLGVRWLDGHMGVNAADDEGYYARRSNVVIDGYIYKLEHPVKSYLIMGTDASGNENAKGEEYRGSMADFQLLMVVDEREKKYGFVELNRDTITDVPVMDHDGTVDAYDEIQLCTAHWYGGSKRMSCRNAVDAASKLLYCVPINGYYALPMDAIGTMNGLVGGVTVTMDKDLTDIDPAFKEGATVTLTDEQAEAYLRSRMGVEDGENASRMERQRNYLNALFERVQEENAKDDKFIVDVYKHLEQYATSDINLNVVTRLGQNLNEYETLGILRIAGEAGEGYALGDDELHSEFYADDASIREVIMQLYPLVNTGVESEYDAEY